MWCVYREMHSPEKALVEDHIKEKKDRSYGGQKVKNLKEEHKTIKEDRG